LKLIEGGDLHLDWEHFAAGVGASGSITEELGDAETVATRIFDCFSMFVGNNTWECASLKGIGEKKAINRDIKESNSGPPDTT
jgi:hypothetical protein